MKAYFTNLALALENVYFYFIVYNTTGHRMCMIFYFKKSIYV